MATDFELGSQSQSAESKFNDVSYIFGIFYGNVVHLEISKA